ncbi:MAG: hypothetical protein JWQ75_2895 [Pseudarthrobacter sp.]|nr:hypothetical protein [Pseudarthrobacter sp.]
MAADRVAALQSAGPAAVGVGVADDGGGEDVLGAAEVVAGLAEELPAAVVCCVCGWLGPQPVSSSNAAAAAVEMTNPWEERRDSMAQPLWLM